MSGCETCGGSGVIDTSPPAVWSAPWLESDAPCPTCDGTGERTARRWGQSEIGGVA